MSCGGIFRRWRMLVSLQSGVRSLDGHQSPLKLTIKNVPLIIYLSHFFLPPISLTTAGSQVLGEQAEVHQSPERVPSDA